MRRRFSVVLWRRTDLEQIIATTCAPISPRWAPLMAASRSFSGCATPQRQKARSQGIALITMRANYGVKISRAALL